MRGQHTPVRHTRLQGRAGTTAREKSIVLAGGGPRAAMLLERLSANRPALFSGPLRIHVVDPFPPGAGRIWRRDQSPLLKLNSRAADVTVFTDSSVECAGPAVEGPSLVEWAAGVLDGSIPDGRGPHGTDADLEAQLRDLRPESFPTRRLQSLYLEWFYRSTVAALGPGTTVEVHADTVVAVEPNGAAETHGSAEANDAGPHHVRLATGVLLPADAIVLALGHTEAAPSGGSAGFADFAARHGAVHVPPAYTNDVDLSVLAPGSDVLVSGLGLAFIDLMVLLFEGRGGSFRESSGRLEYVPSGREPRLWVGSRRGVPYRSKIRGDLRGAAPASPLFLTPAAVAALVERHGRLDFRRDLWPLMAKDAAYAYYRELFTGHPGRTEHGWERFSARFADVDWYSPEREALVAQSVPDPADRLDFEALDFPLAGRRFDAAGAEAAVAAHIEDDLALRDGGENSETLGLFLGLLSVYFELGRLVPPEALTDESRSLVAGWWHGFFSYVDSGPPAHRLRELLALHRAGMVRFLGPGTTFGTNEADGTFVGVSDASGHAVAARSLVEARLPEAGLAGSANPLLRSLAAAGLAVADHADGRLVVDPENRVLDAAGRPVPWLHAVGAGTTGWGSGAFARPRSNAAPFRHTDALARTLLSSLAALRDAPAPASPTYSRTRLQADLAAAHSYLG
ncbi:FAD/NAD(P)-binding protein [Arthrobacter ginkgonis]